MVESERSWEGLESRRLSNQNRQILERLRRGDATNHELVKIALKYNARISELRDSGYNVVCIENNKSTGIATYRLVA
jgi:ribosomal protein L32E